MRGTSILEDWIVKISQNVGRARSNRNIDEDSMLTATVELIRDSVSVTVGKG